MYFALGLSREWANLGVENFHGIQLSWNASLQTFHGLIFKDTRNDTYYTLYKYASWV